MPAIGMGGPPSSFGNLKAPGTPSPAQSTGPAGSLKAPAGQGNLKAPGVPSQVNFPTPPTPAGQAAGTPDLRAVMAELATIKQMLTVLTNAMGQQQRVIESQAQMQKLQQAAQQQAGRLGGARSF